MPAPRSVASTTPPQYHRRTRRSPIAPTDPSAPAVVSPPGENTASSANAGEVGTIAADDPISRGNAAGAGRLVSLDVFRGLTIAAMILVNNPGDWGHIYWPLGHAPWHGWTPTDLIFPFFLSIVGVSMVFSFAARSGRGAAPAQLARHVLWRSGVIFAVGLFLNGFPRFHLAKLRIPGVLQRIAVCYLIAALIVLVARRRSLNRQPAMRDAAPVLAVIFVLLVGYWALMTFVPVPGYGAGNLTPQGNLAAYIDRALLGGHLWSQTRNWDPEGPLSTLPAIATVLIGVLVGDWLCSRHAPQLKTYGLFFVGGAFVFLGRLLDTFFPINKNLWTSSYVILTAGFAMILLTVCYWLVEIRGTRRWAEPFLVFGTNALFVYAFSELLAISLDFLKLTMEQPAACPPDCGASAVLGRVSLHSYIYNRFFAPLASPENASLLFALCFVLLCLGVNWLLYRRRIFLKI